MSKIKKFDGGGKASIAEGNKAVYDQDFESAQRDYRKHRNASDPTPSQMSYLLGREDTTDKAWETRAKAQARASESSRLGGDNAGLGRGHTKGMKKGGSVKSASERADGCCIRGKTRA